jgi:hypothetical protein
MKPFALILTLPPLTNRFKREITALEKAVAQLQENEIGN